MIRVAFAGTFAHRLEPRVRAHLDVPCEVILVEEADAPALGGVDVLVSLAFTRAMGAAAPRLRLVQVPGAGLDRIERAALGARTSLANAYGHETGIAEYILGAMLALTRDFARLDAALRRGTWDSQWAVEATPPAPWPELAGKTLGILGYGHIGRSLARRARAFDMTVLAVRRHATAGDGDAVVRGPDGLADTLARADYLAITLPLTLETRGLLGRPELAAMKRTAVLVNVARAEIIDEDALYAALAARTIAAAALDVWYRYPSQPGPTPPARRPFHELPNVLMTPHASGWTEGMLEARARLIAENIRRTARGEPPLNSIATGD
ncbi:MAG TPA: 2-hydroxyacid dehydrogenase [Methylomirabilota bacterium]